MMEFKVTFFYQDRAFNSCFNIIEEQYRTQASTELKINCFLASIQWKRTGIQASSQLKFLLIKGID